MVRNMTQTPESRAEPTTVTDDDRSDAWPSPKGPNVKVVQKLLGHKSAVLTLDKYGHLFPDDLDAVADAFDTAADGLRTVTALKPVGVARNTL
jgi:hypothetical protein